MCRHGPIKQIIMFIIIELPLSFRVLYLFDSTKPLGLCFSCIINTRIQTPLPQSSSCLPQLFIIPFFFAFTVLLFLLHPMSLADNRLGLQGLFKFDPSGINSQNLQTVLVSLWLQSEQMPFFTTTLGDGQNVINSNNAKGTSQTPLAATVSKILDMLENLCGKVVAAIATARVQLIGCYLRYEILEFKQVRLRLNWFAWLVEPIRRVMTMGFRREGTMRLVWWKSDLTPCGACRP